MKNLHINYEWAYKDLVHENIIYISPLLKIIIYKFCVTKKYDRIKG